MAERASTHLPLNRTVLRTIIPPDLSRVRDARQLAEEIGTAVAMDELRLFDLKVAVSEVCASAIEDVGKEVKVEAWLLSDRIVIEVLSHGALDPRMRAHEGSSQPGLGLLLSSALADQVQVSRLDDSQTRVSLTFLRESNPEEGTKRPASSRVRAIESKRARLLQDPRVHGFVLTRAEMREREDLERRLAREAFYDPLTELANRALFLDRAENTLSAARRRDGVIVVALLDLDEFKRVNDTLGHAAGDRLLATFGARLRGLLRAEDTAARLGGDEFALLMDGGIEPSDIPGAIDRILDHLRKPYDLGGTHVSATVSAGIATSDGSANTVTELLRHADLALYAAKSQGRDCWKLFEPHMLEAERAKKDAEDELRHGLEREEIVAYYQPILSTKIGRIVAFEALARWRHPNGKVLLPESFIGLAEETGLIVPLGYAVFKQACRSLCDWDARFPDSQLQLTVNVSARQLGETGLVDRMADLAGTNGVSPDRIVFEMGEEVLAGSALGTLETLNALREVGFVLAIDDFGVGHSSLTRLKEYSIDILKVAKPLVDSIDERSDGIPLASAAVGLARSLGMQVVAQGVEKRGQLELLRSFGCDMWQGRYFSMPVGPRKAHVLLERSLDPRS